MSVKESSIQRLKNTHFAINVSFDRLKKSLNYGEEKQIYLELGNLLLWVLTADEWLKKNDRTYVQRRNKDSSGELLKGLRHAYNLVKHDTQYIQAHETNVQPKFSFPFSDPFELGLIYFVWAENKEFEGHENQRKVYDKRMVGKNILDAFQLAIPFLENEIQKY